MLDVPVSIDVVNVFRTAAALPAIADTCDWMGI
jgi:predicted CoA-binding protein